VAGAPLGGDRGVKNFRIFLIWRNATSARYRQNDDVVFNSRRRTLMEIRVIVADSARARIFSSHTTVQQLEEVEAFAHTQSRRLNQDLVSDGPGRNSEWGDDYSPHSTAKELEAEGFAHSLAQHLKEMHDRENFRSLMLVAPPKFLGLLRKQLPSSLEKLVSRTVDKDLCTAPLEDIIDHLHN
jgi:protein required for attachment to host cells